MYSLRLVLSLPQSRLPLHVLSLTLLSPQQATSGDRAAPFGATHSGITGAAAIPRALFTPSKRAGKRPTSARTPQEGEPKIKRNPAASDRYWDINDVEMKPADEEVVHPLIQADSSAIAEYIRLRRSIGLSNLPIV
ncbi:hypothetical protein CAEBREN_00778 [Caenorhabditis brenneri]|uniref:Uncharacterized protein n=1 Tax=Caenorhabditis brenneri TaxID=135651 RepID=G0NNQ1_CAEBE|nr:hypothetical protein CAEBREN_00778 [Caenorhabditis brenneri]